MISLGGGLFLSPLAIQILRTSPQTNDPAPLPITNTTVPLTNTTGSTSTTFIFENAMTSPYRALLQNFSVYTIDRPAPSLATVLDPLSTYSYAHIFRTYSNHSDQLQIAFEFQFEYLAIEYLTVEIVDAENITVAQFMVANSSVWRNANSTYVIDLAYDVVISSVDLPLPIYFTIQSQKTIFTFHTEFVDEATIFAPRGLTLLHTNYSQTEFNMLKDQQPPPAGWAQNFTFMKIRPAVPNQKWINESVEVYLLDSFYIEEIAVNSNVFSLDYEEYDGLEILPGSHIDIYTSGSDESCYFVYNNQTSIFGSGK
jgi:hypothetical protein